MEAKLKRTAVQFLTDYRGIFVCIALLPLSVIANALTWLSMQYRIWSMNAAKHNERVSKIAINMRRLYEEAKDSKDTNNEICTSRPGFANMSIKMGEHKENKRKIKIDLVDILELNTKEMYLHVEPLVNVGQITSYLLPRGFTLPVVPELDELTVGGLIAGFGIESTSGRYGLFQEIIQEIELVLADGSVITATAKNEHKDLFFAVPWSHGSIAMIVSMKIDIIPAKRYITLKYRRCEGLKQISSAFNEASDNSLKGNKDALFVEALQYTLDKACLMTGELSDEIPQGSKLNDISLWYKKWFYQHCEDTIDRLQSNNPDSYILETIPLKAYYHRHTRSIFFEMPHIIPFADQLWFRYLLGWALPPNIPLLKVSQTDATRRMWIEQFCVQDMLVPASKLSETLKYCHDNLAVYPIWLCPHLVVRHKEGGYLKPSRFVDKNTEKEMYVDIGLYGVPASKKNGGYEHVRDMRALEDHVRSVDGYQGLYAVTYAKDEDTFREMFDHKLYDKVREKYGAVGRFPTTYKKVVSNKAWEKK